MSILFGKKPVLMPKNILEVVGSQGLEFACVQGEIFKILDTKGPDRSRAYTQIVNIYDGTHSMTVKVITKDLVDFDTGMGIKVEGTLETNEIIVAKNIETYEVVKTKKEDPAEKKYVSLQAFTKTGTILRGAQKPSELVKMAAQFGHTAVAITDLQSVQGFPELYQEAKGKNIKPIFGMTAKIVDDKTPIIYNPPHIRIDEATYAVFDVETTGFSTNNDYVTEIGAAKIKNGEVIETFNRLVKVPKPIPAHITELTGITDEMLQTEGVSLEKAMMEFDAFIAGTILVAHNAQFDRDHLTTCYERVGKQVPTIHLLDTLMLSRAINTHLKVHNLKKLSREYKVKLDNHHRAYEDSVATGHIMLGMFEQLKEKEIEFLDELNSLIPEDHFKNIFPPKEITLLVRNDKGLKNLYKLVSKAHTEYLARDPLLTWDLLAEYRDGIIVGSGSHLGALFDKSLNKPIEQVYEEIKHYDYVEIQPADVAEHFWNSDNPETDNEACIIEAWKRIIVIAKEMRKPIVATGHVHYAEEEDRLVHNILLYNEVPPSQRVHEKRRGRFDQMQGPCHFRTTEEMLNSFPWLPKEEVYTYVVENTNKISSLIENIPPIPVNEEGEPILFTPKIDGVDEEFEKMVYENAHKMYGKPLPKIVEDRVEKELRSIIKHGFAVIYMITQKLVKKSLNDGYLVGSRGSVGSSLAATMTEITEVNPLPPHYVCPESRFSVFLEHEAFRSGYDLPAHMGTLIDPNVYDESARNHVMERMKEVLPDHTMEQIEQLLKNHVPGKCPVTGKDGLQRDGQDIPFETFLGFKGDKVPDIDLNFSGVYQPTAHQYVVDLFGEKYVYRAGTISTVADKTAFGFVKNYQENHNLPWTMAEVSRMAGKAEGAKRSTGQHPGGMLVVPDYMDVTDITPYQFPANAKVDKSGKANFRTSHFDFHAIHDNILKLDILGHDVPTILRYLHDLSGIDPKTIKSADEKVIKLFYAPEEVLGVKMEDIKAKVGTLGMPELGTNFTQGVILETNPRSFADLVTFSGLTHGTDVYANNAQVLIQNGTCTIREVIGCRDDIMVKMIQKGLDQSLAFTIMESVRKGKGLKPEWEEEMRKYDVPDWYIWSCKKIKYMFPKAHAVAYVLDAIRLGYYKVYHPAVYYTAMFSSRFNSEDLLEIIQPAPKVRQRMDELQKEIKELKYAKENNKANKLASLYNALNLALEAKERGIVFETVRLYESHADMYQMEGNKLIAPFSSINGIGEKVAERLYEEAQKAPFRGLADLQARTGANKTNIEVLRNLGCLDNVEEKQHTFF